MPPPRAITRRRSLALLGGILAVAAPGSARAARGGAGLFGSHETMRTAGGRFPKWQGALDRTLDERKLLQAACRPDAITACQLQEWQQLLRQLAPLPFERALDAVNLEMNKRAYILDPINWGVPDYWASPGQFFRKNGDCEDYAIAKYMSMRSLGIPVSQMRIVVLHDENLKIPHAVLAVRSGNDQVILDNQTDKIVSHRVIRHYRPIFSINEEAWWLHR